jgi:hypothetical protein
MTLGAVWVYHLQVGESAGRGDRPIEGGKLTLSDDIRSIFEPAFLGQERRSPARQPFHFNLSGRIRANTTRDHLLAILQEDNPEASEHCEALARQLQLVIDDRIGDLLFTVAVGWEQHSQRCALWVYPSDSPIRFFSKAGHPMVEELRHAFSRRSRYRKAVFFDGPRQVTRNDFLRGELVDSTRQGKSRSTAHYWVERFLLGQIELKAARGVMYLCRALREAQKASETADERTSVVAAYSVLLSGTRDTTSLAQFSLLLSGKAKAAYTAGIPSTIERDAVFDLDRTEIAKRVGQVVFVLENKLEVVFPADASVDPDDYLHEIEGRICLRLDVPVVSRMYK